MKKPMLIIFLSIVLVGSGQLFAQTCGTRQLDPRIAFFLKLIGNEDLTVEQLRKIPIEQIKLSA
ncbi:MAG TPA: hypothetical protein VIQ00_07765, partial [Chitinophagaceae bacterium]